MTFKTALVGAVTVGMMLAGSSAHAISITQNNNATALANALLGTGVSIVNPPVPTTVGNAAQYGTFTNGIPEVGFSSGVVLSSGNVNQIAGANSNGGATESVGVGASGDDDLSTNYGGAGDAGLTALAGNNTFDAAILQFDFQFGDGTSVNNSLFLNFAFASEEYVDYIGSSFNDAFAFFLDGVNIATTPGGSAITINNINNTSNSGLYVNNVANTNGLAVAGRQVKFDGLTTVLTAQALNIGAGVHTMKFAVADTSDGILDAGVFLQGGTFSTTPSPVPVPGALWLFLSGLTGLGIMARRQKQKAI